MYTCYWFLLSSLFTFSFPITFFSLLIYLMKNIFLVSLYHLFLIFIFIDSSSLKKTIMTKQTKNNKISNKFLLNKKKERRKNKERNKRE